MSPKHKTTAAGITDAELSALDETYVPNATYRTPPTDAELGQDRIQALYTYMEAENAPIQVIGDSGIGKTAGWKAEAARRGHRVVYWNMANRCPEDAAVPMPTITRVGEEDVAYLDFLLSHELLGDDPFVLIMDEPWRAGKQVDNQSLELVQNRALGAHKLNMRGIVALNNESLADGFRSGRRPDLAWADRWTTVKFTEHDTAWRRALAGMFPDWDLNELFAARAELDEKARRVLSPRTMQHLIDVAISGLPMGLALPVIRGKRTPVVDASGQDRTSEVLTRFAAALGVPHRDHTARIPDLLEKVTEQAIARRWTVYVEGPHGIGKTAYFTDKLAKAGLKVADWSMPNASPESFAVPFPMKDENGVTKLRQLVHKVFADDTPKALLLDEVWRTDANVRNKLMEILQEKSINSESIRGWVCTFALNNPPQFNGYKYDVGTPDAAQASRFDISLQIGPDDVPATAWLYAKYGEEAEPFLDWYKEDLDDLGRVLITKRTLERMIKLWRNGITDLDIAKAYIPGEDESAGYVGPPLMELYARLADRPLARIRRIVAQVEQYETWLAQRDPSDPSALPNRERHGEVRTAFARAELAQLEENYDAVVRLMAVLAPNMRITLFRGTSQDRQRFWIKVLEDVKARASA